MNVLQCLVQIAQLPVYYRLGLFRALDRLAFKRLNGFYLPAHIISCRLERTELLLDIVDDGLVLKDAAVLAEVNRLRLFGKDRDFAAGVVVALFEGLQGSGSLTF